MCGDLPHECCRVLPGACTANFSSARELKRLTRGSALQGGGGFPQAFLRGLARGLLLRDGEPVLFLNGLVLLAGRVALCAAGLPLHVGVGGPLRGEGLGTRAVKLALLV